MTSSASEVDIRSDLRRHLDSLVQERLLAELQRIESVARDVDTEVILFDTTQPAEEDSGGLRLPPVKAIVKQSSREKADAREQLRSEQTREVNKIEESTDKGTTAVSTAVETEQRPGWWAQAGQKITTAIAAAVLLLMGWLIYKLVKLFRNGK